MKLIVLTCGLAALAVTARGADPRTFVVDPAESVVTIHVGKAGLFKFAGHEHEVIATKLSGHVRADAERIAGSSVVLAFEAKALSVSEKGEPSGDAAKVQEKMSGPDVLEVIRFPEIGFHSRTVSGKATSPGLYELEIAGDLGLHGVTKSLVLKVRVELKGDVLTATGQVSFKQSDFGLRPVSVAGVVKVKDEVAITYKIVARAAR